jgi:hypothetical protein
MGRNVAQKKMSTENDNELNASRSDAWTSQEIQLSKSRYGCEILHEGCSKQDAKNPELPLDAYLVTYVYDNKVCYDITRSPKRSKIFDLYWDKFREGLKSIVWADGKVNPKLWGYQAPKSKKRK